MLLPQFSTLTRHTSMGMLAISLGFHSLLMLLPYDSQPKTTESPHPSKDIQKVRVSATSPAPQRTFPTPTPSSPPSPVNTIPTPVLNPSSPLNHVNTANNALGLARSTPAAFLPDSALVSKNNSSNNNSPAFPPELIPNTPPLPSFEDFPKYPNAQPGSFNLISPEQNQASQQTIDDLSKVSLYFEQYLPIYKYQFQLVTQEDRRRVYQVSKGSLVKFLTLIFQPSQGTIILLANAPLDLTVLNNIETASQFQIAFEQVLVDLKSFGSSRIDIPEFYFDQPEFFYFASSQDPKNYDMQKPRAGFDGNFILILKQTPEQILKDFFNPRLSNQGFTITNAGTYGGGILYEVRRQNYVRYLNLLTTKDKTATIVVIWERSPT